MAPPPPPDLDDDRSMAQILAESGEGAIDDFLAGLKPDEAKRVMWEWEFHGRKKQLWPGRGQNCGPEYGCDHKTDEWATWILLAGRGYGKLLCINEDILTTRGWIKLGDVKVGDEVYDESGRPSRVAATYDQTPEKAYRLTFSDGATIDACGDHLWTTWTHAERKALRGAAAYPDEWPEWRATRRVGGMKPLAREVVERVLARKATGLSQRETCLREGVSRGAMRAHWNAERYVPREESFTSGIGPHVRTTTEIFETTRLSGNGANHAVPLALPPQTPHRELLVDPYVLGLWLGDGSKSSPLIAANKADKDHVVRKLNEAGYDNLNVKWCDRKDDRGDGGCWTIYVRGGLLGQLRSIGVLGMKHVPREYLDASPAQRLELLRGLMDSDGSCGVNDGMAYFGTTSPALRDAVAELATGLSEKPRVYDGRATIYGKDYGPRWQVVWRPSYYVPFKLARKAERVRPFDTPQMLRNRARMLVDVQPIETKPMRCLTVDSRHNTFLIGRGLIVTHNTFVGAHATHRVAMKSDDFGGIIHMIAPSPADYRDVMVEGPSGILALAPKWERPEFRTTKRSLTWPNGAKALMFSAFDPEALRGPQCGFIWMDEPAAWQYGQQTFDMAQMGLRLGRYPRQVMTTTPKPYAWLKEIIKDGNTHLTHGTTFENMANLPTAFRTAILRRYEGTTLGQQELYAQLLEAVDGALWTPELLERTRRMVVSDTRPRVAVAIDPAVSTGESSDETGIIVGCIDENGEGYVLEDRSMARASPDAWAREAIASYYRHRADAIVCEVNNGGDMVEHTIRTYDRNARIIKVHASRGKAIRAEPVVALFEQDRCHMLGTHPKLEAQLTNWVPGVKESVKSPDRLDAMVWCMTHLMVDTGRARLIA